MEPTKTSYSSINRQFGLIKEESTAIKGVSDKVASEVGQNALKKLTSSEEADIFFNETNFEFLLGIEIFSWKSKKVNIFSIGPSTEEENVVTMHTKEPKPYTKDDIRTKDLIPTKKELGKGTYGTVYEHGKQASLAVKKTYLQVEYQNKKVFSIEEEFKLGSQLDHPHLVKIHDLYIKKYLDGRKDKYKLVMDKIEGKTINSYAESGEKLSDETVKKLLQQLQNCCLYLFNKGIAWNDTNPDNIFITKEKNDLMLCDYGMWLMEENPQTRTLWLLYGAKTIVSYILNSSSKELTESISLPEELYDKVATMEEDALRNFLSDYFDTVLKAFEYS